MAAGLGIASRGEERYIGYAEGWNFHGIGSFSQRVGFDEEIGTFEGEIVNGLDLYTLASGERFSGSVKEEQDTTTALGMYEGAGNDVAIGQFAFDRRGLNGFGLASDAGNIAIGHWKYGKLNGYGLKVDKAGKLIEQGVYSEGALTTPLFAD